ncbi:hypothetical protein ALC60_02198, partial [Trachymyrmex zeteki]
AFTLFFFASVKLTGSLHSKSTTKQRTGIICLAVLASIICKGCGAVWPSPCSLRSERIGERCRKQGRR